MSNFFLVSQLNLKGDTPLICLNVSDLIRIPIEFQFHSYNFEADSSLFYRASNFFFVPLQRSRPPNWKSWKHFIILSETMEPVRVRLGSLVSI